ncbi:MULTISPECIES: antitoxin Xre/MbcA/ParS toxin-binding domain-containing protein [Vibrio]|uniref:type II RES/Xre toxin-antitoxin system antitoxin n=1 Tax=Vibrio TaxID=662 RepID=UPI000769E81C|nr:MULTISPECIES: antitoxin Xre/MbcA/ParS toxin-binding domain-containing protein [Vibrio]
MATATLKSFKPKQPHKANFWFMLGIEDAETGRTDAVHKGFEPKVYRNIVERVKLSQSEFQHVTLIPVSTIKRRLKNEERFNTQESDAIYRLAMLLKLATELFDDEERALGWMRENVYGLGGKRPLDMVSTTVDFEIVKDLIGRLEHGVFS